MEEIRLKELWRASTEKLEELIVLNKQHTEDITKMKVHNFVASMKPIKIFTIIAGILWVGSGSVILTNLFMYAFDKISLFLLFSAAIQVLLTAIALILYIYQLILIYQVDISQPVLETQEKLARLKSSTLWVTRILFLQLPVWTTFYLGEYHFTNGSPFLIVQTIVTISFTWLAIWLFFNIRYENRNKKWFRLLFSGKEWDPLLKSLELLNQVDGYKQEN